MKGGNIMRKVRLVHWFNWTQAFCIILALWTTMGQAGDRRSQRQSDNYSSNLARAPLSTNRRNGLRDRLSHNSQSQNNYNSQRIQNRQSDQPSSRILRTGDENYENQNQMWPYSRKSTTTTTTTTTTKPIPIIPYSYSSNLDNSMSNKLFESNPNLYSFHQIQTLSNSDVSNSNRRNQYTSSVSSGGIKKQRKKTFPQRAASVNSILRLDPEYSVWDENSAVCRTIPGLTREQMQLCYKNPEATRVALQGVSLAADECAFQMSKNRWNCSSLKGRMNPHSTILFKKGYRESAFGHAINSAGVTYAISKACAQGNLLSCGCGFQYDLYDDDDQVNSIPSKDADFSDESNGIKTWSSVGSGRGSPSSWKWSGCSHNVDYGVKFAKTFLDSRERASDLPSKINLHNNRVGRMVVASNMEIRCKCHGLSGSCSIRSCWRSAPDFRQVGTVLKNKFRRAVMIDQSELGNRPLNRVHKLGKQRRKRQDRPKRNAGNIQLWYYERSPTYCEKNSDLSIPGTTGRVCSTGTPEVGGPPSCSTLCCGRGYNTIRQVYTKRCQCQFHWCCEVACLNCTISEYITVCK